MTGRVFQSALPRGERPITGGNKNGTYYFNPRSREGSDMMQLEKVERCRISIRAPARGATGIPDAHDPKHVDFNPRSREGSDIFHILFDSYVVISIRAPARGATLTLC